MTQKVWPRSDFSLNNLYATLNALRLLADLCCSERVAYDESTACVRKAGFLLRAVECCILHPDPDRRCALIEQKYEPMIQQVESV